MSDTILYYFFKAVSWLNPALQLVGLGIAVWAFLRCRKCGYLVLAGYFALTIAWRPITRVLHAHRPPDVSVQTQQKIDAAVNEAIHQVLVAEGHPAGIPAELHINVPLGQAALVFGLWLVARREEPWHRPKPPAP